MAEDDHNAAAKAWRKIIKEWPDQPTPYFNLGAVLQRSNHVAETAPMFLKAMELFEEDTKGWAVSAAEAFDTLKTKECREVPKPEWWNGEGLKALAARVVAVTPDHHKASALRARVLSGDALEKASWHAGPRTATEIKEVATWYRRAAKVTPAPSGKLLYERLASHFDEFADPLLAKEEAEAATARTAAEAEAAKARAAAKAEAVEALKVAEAAAAAAAEELLAEEEKEKQQASTKAKQVKGKKGKGMKR